MYLHDAVNLVVMPEWTKRQVEGRPRQLAPAIAG
jgi:hypothetical protein